MAADPSGLVESRACVPSPAPVSHDCSELADDRARRAEGRRRQEEQAPSVAHAGVSWPMPPPATTARFVVVAVAGFVWPGARALARMVAAATRAR